MRAFIAENPQGKHGVHRYAPEEYGLDVPRERERFARYTERFGIEPEPEGPVAGRVRGHVATREPTGPAGVRRARRPARRSARSACRDRRSARACGRRARDSRPARARPRARAAPGGTARTGRAGAARRARRGRADPASRVRRLGCTRHDDAARGQARRRLVDGQRVVTRLAAPQYGHRRAQAYVTHLRPRARSGSSGSISICSVLASWRDSKPSPSSTRGEIGRPSCAARVERGEQLGTAHEPRARGQEARLPLRLDEAQARTRPMTFDWTMIASRSVTSFGDEERALREQLLASSAARRARRRRAARGRAPPRSRAA